MGFLIVSLAFLICSAFASLEENSYLVQHDVEGYYWREYTGHIPRDAVPGGLAADGTAIYIGQVLYNTHVYPGQIRQAEKSIIYYDGGHEQRTKASHIKILCTQYPET